MDESQPRPPAASDAQMVEPVMPGDANVLGSAFGGRVMQWIDLCGAVAAQRHCRKPVVTASMDELHFHAPVKVGHWAVLHSRVVAAFRTSMEVGVTVHTEDPLSGERRLCTSAFLTFVALDGSGKPSPVPPVSPQTDEEKRLESEAHNRRAERLARKRELISFPAR
jgi:acyl-CoA hydrolase